MQFQSRRHPARLLKHHPSGFFVRLAKRGAREYIFSSHEKSARPRSRTARILLPPKRVKIFCGLCMNGMNDSMSGRERMMAGMLRWAPWLSFFLVALPFPLFFLFLYLVSSVAETAAIYFVAALLSLAIGSIAGLFVMIFLLVYRKRWYKRLRDKMAADGITADAGNTKEAQRVELKPRDYFAMGCFTGWWF